MCAGTGSSPPEVFPGRREIPQSLREGIQEPCRVCWEQQHCLHQASCPAQWYQDVPKCSSLTTSALVWSPNRATAPPSSAAKPQPLLHCWHSTPGAQGTQNWVLQAPWGAGLALETGLESIHPTGKVVMDWCWGYNRGKQAGAQLGEIPSFKGMIQREAIHGAPAPMATREST